MNSLAGRLILLMAANTAVVQAAGAALGGWADLASPAPRPHPAVVRVSAPGANRTMSLGSGVLVALSPQHGLVLTNWHVVEDARGQILVSFPDGFSSGATVVKVDRDWDLAALLIWRPRTAAVPLAAQPPTIGAPLTIAGYGSGSYRAVSGRCVQYVAPAANLPNDMIELGATARQGDSGGPIFNERGEVAGVLFGTGGGRTTGSHCNRVRWFLADILRGSSPTPDGTMLAQAPRPPGQHSQYPARPVSGSPRAADSSAGWDGSGGGELPAAIQIPPEAGAAPAAPAADASGAAQAARTDGVSAFEMAKNVLAAIGVFAIFFACVRLLTTTAES